MESQQRCSTYYIYGKKLDKSQRTYIKKQFGHNLTNERLDEMYLPNLLTQNHQIIMLISQISLLLLALVILGLLVHNVTRYCLKERRYKSIMFTSFNIMTLLIVCTEITYAVLGIILGL